MVLDAGGDPKAIRQAGYLNELPYLVVGGLTRLTHFNGFSVSYLEFYTFDGSHGANMMVWDMVAPLSFGILNMEVEHVD
jgi:hypothetical protein